MHVRSLANVMRTIGLDYVATLSNGRRVYSDLGVVLRSDDSVQFEGGAVAGLNSLTSGSVPGKIVTTWGSNFQSISF
jgi:hypothetical protein